MPSVSPSPPPASPASRFRFPSINRYLKYFRFGRVFRRKRTTEWLGSDDLSADLAMDDLITKDIVSRYSSVSVFEVENSVRQDVQIERPLIAGRQYALEVSIAPTQTGVPVEGEAEAIRPLYAEDASDLFVVLTPEVLDEWEIYDPIQPLQLPVQGPTQSPATFALSPKPGTPAKRRRLWVRIYYRLNLVDSLTFAPFVVPADEEHTQPFDGKPPLYIAFKEFPERFVEIESNLSPRKLNISLKRMVGNEWRITAVLDVAGRPVPLVGYANLSDAKMKDILDDTRSAWDSVVTDDRLYDPNERSAALASAASALARAGRQAWNNLVSSGGGEALNSMGRMLEENPPMPGAAIQIICEERSVDFVFPWTLLYATAYEATQPADIAKFWGSRYNIEVRNLQVVGKRLIGPECRIGYAYWRSSVAARQNKMLSDLAAQRKDRIVVVEPGIETSRDFMTTLSADSLDLLYVFAHGFTSTPDLGSLATLNAWLTAKAAKGALPDELIALKANLDGIALENKEDWIKLTKTTLTFSQLQEFRKRLYRRPIVFLNMCQSAQVNPGISNGFVGFFLNRGACAVIGTDCAIPAFFAETFAEHVFEYLAKGLAVGDSVYAARMSCVRAGNPLALAYSVYGYADSQFVEPV
jgi:hypothetical protein